jgi:flavin-binding protein dodecin
VIRGVIAETKKFKTRYHSEYPVPFDRLIGRNLESSHMMEATNHLDVENILLPRGCAVPPRVVTIAGQRQRQRKRRGIMADSVYKVIELVGSSPDSWEDAAKNAIEMAGKSLKELRIAEIAELDLKVEEGKVVAYRARVKVSFKYMGKE